MIKKETSNMNKENKGVFGESHSTATVKEMLANYFTNWPLFLASILICVSAGVLYTRYTVPKYLATTSFLIKGGDGGKPSSDDLIESALSGKKEVNLNNEIMLINAASLM